MPTPKGSSPPARKPQYMTMDEIQAVKALAQLMYDGGMATKDAGKPEKIAVKILVGRSIGIPDAQSPAMFDIINGRVCLRVEGALALARKSGLMEKFEEHLVGNAEDETLKATVIIKRKNEQERTYVWTVDDAKRAKLWNKEGPWQTYPQRQIKWRALGWALRDVFTDILLGLGIVEEESDIVPALPSATPPDSPSTVATRSEAVTHPMSVPIPALDSPSADDEHMDATEKDLGEIKEWKYAWLSAAGINPLADKDRVAKAWQSFKEEVGIKEGGSLNRGLTRKIVQTLKDKVEKLSPPKEPSPAISGTQDGSLF